jgi:5'-3' exonuclease
LEGKLLTYIDNLSNKYKYCKPEITFSFSDESGEGEIKICNEIVNNSKNNLNCRHLIIGNDADIIVLSMGVKPIYNINILFNGHCGRELVSLKSLLTLFTTFLNKDTTFDIMINSDLRDDFVLVSLLMGNDYLPKMAFVNYIKLWDCYYAFAKENKGTLLENGKFNIKNMKAFVYLIYSNLLSAGKHVTIDTYNKDRVESYLQGLLWCLNIYNTGICNDYSYSYIGCKPVHPYELYFYLFAETIKYEIKTTPPIKSEIYTLLIMPLSAKHLIQKKYHNLMDNELKYIYEAENCTNCKKLKDDYVLTNSKIKTCDNKKLSDKLTKTYNEQFAEYIKHKKTHQQKFNSNDIKYIIKLCDDIK